MGSGYLLEYQSISQGRWVMPNVAGCDVVWLGDGVRGQPVRLPNGLPPLSAMVSSRRLLSGAARAHPVVMSVLALGFGRGGRRQDPGDGRCRAAAFMRPP